MVNESVAIAILLISFFGFIVFRMPVAYAIGVSSVITMAYLKLPLMQIVQNCILSFGKRESNRSRTCTKI